MFLRSKIIFRKADRSQVLDLKVDTNRPQSERRRGSYSLFINKETYNVTTVTTSQKSARIRNLTNWNVGKPH